MNYIIYKRSSLHTGNVLSMQVYVILSTGEALDQKKGAGSEQRFLALNSGGIISIRSRALSTPNAKISLHFG
uniref:Uncharacterized protein n=1 Tax=Anguilla anguilla TaxID=7936 RepID=A0A0E9WLX2_ANGAN